MNDYGYASDNAGTSAETANVHRPVLSRVAASGGSKGTVRTVRNGPRLPSSRLIGDVIALLSINAMGALLMYGYWLGRTG